jgi:hypothetical protein
MARHADDDDMQQTTSNGQHATASFNRAHTPRSEDMKDATCVLPRHKRPTVTDDAGEQRTIRPARGTIRTITTWHTMRRAYKTALRCDTRRGARPRTVCSDDRAVDVRAVVAVRHVRQTDAAQ